MNKPYFVMAYTQDGLSATPIVTDDQYGNEIVEFFETEREAEELARNQIMCSNFGYQIFCMGEE